MAINNITGEVTFTFNEKEYSVRPELGLAARIEGSVLFPNKSENSVYDLLFMFERKSPLITVVGKMLYVVLNYIGAKDDDEKSFSETQVLNDVFKLQQTDKFFLFYREMSEIADCLCSGGVKITEKEQKEVKDSEVKELGKP